MDKVVVNEIFFSISGEGISTGLPTVFIRLAGCSLRCGKIGDRKLWCDTPYALSAHSGKEMTIDEVLVRIQDLASGSYQLLLTGGEPLEGSKKFFCQRLVKVVYKKRHNNYDDLPRVETNGRESLAGLETMCFTMDYKLPGSGMEEQMDTNNLQILKERNHPLDEIKFVIRDRPDYERARHLIAEYQLERNLLFSPVEGECDPRQLVQWLKEDGLKGSRLSLQLHKILWGNQRGV